MSLRSSAAALKKQVGGRDWKRFDVMRFAQEGVCFRGKLIGVLEVSEARGEKMCQEAMADLKMAIAAAGEHKRKIIIGIALDGLRLRDENSRDCLYHHPVHKISFIAQDATDNRAFGYVFGSPNLGHRFFGIKTDKNAQVVVQTIRDLFEVVFSMKKKEFEKGELLGGIAEARPERTDTRRRESEDPAASQGNISADLLSINLSSTISTPRAEPFKASKNTFPVKSCQDPFGDSFDFGTLSQEAAASVSLSWKKPPKPKPSADFFLATLPPPPRRGTGKTAANSCASSVKAVSREGSFKSSGSGASSSAFNDMFPKWPGRDQSNTANSFPSNFRDTPADSNSNGGVDRYAVFAELEKEINPLESVNSFESNFEAADSPAKKVDSVPNGKLPGPTFEPPLKPSPTQKEFSAIARLRRPQPEGFSLASSADQQPSFFSAFSGPSSYEKPEEVQHERDIFQARWENTPSISPLAKNKVDGPRNPSGDSGDVFEKLVVKIGGSEERREPSSMHQRSFTLTDQTTSSPPANRLQFMGRSEDGFASAVKNPEHSFDDEFGDDSGFAVNRGDIPSKISKPVGDDFQGSFKYSPKRAGEAPVDDKNGEPGPKFAEVPFEDSFGGDFGNDFVKTSDVETAAKAEVSESVGLFSSLKLDEFEKLKLNNVSSSEFAAKTEYRSIWPDREDFLKGKSEDIEERAVEAQQPPSEEKQPEASLEPKKDEEVKLSDVEAVVSPVDDQKFYSDHEHTSSIWTDEKFSTAQDVTDTDNEDTLCDVHDEEQDDYVHEEPSCTLDSMNTAAPSLGNLEADFLSAHEAMSPEPDITFPSVTSGASLQDVSQIASDCTEKADEEGGDDSSEASESETFQADFPPAKLHVSSSTTNEESSTYVSCRESTSARSEATIAEKKEEVEEIKEEVMKEEKVVEEPGEGRPNEAVPPWLKDGPVPMPMPTPPSYPFPTPVPGETAEEFEEKRKKAQEAFWLGYQQWMAAGAFYQQWTWMMQQQGMPLPMAMPMAAPFAMPGAPAMFCPPPPVSPCPPPLPPRTHPLQQQWKWMKADCQRPNSALEFSGEAEDHVPYERGYMSSALTSKRSHMSDDRLYESAMWGGRMLPPRNEEGASPGQQRRRQHQRVVSVDRPRGYHTYNPKFGSKEAHHTSLQDEYYYDEERRSREEEEEEFEEPPPLPARPPSGRRPVQKKPSKEADLPGVEDAWNTYPSSSPLAAEETPKKFQRQPLQKSRSGSVRSRSSTEDPFTPPSKDGFEARFEDAFGATAGGEAVKADDDPWAVKPVPRPKVARKASQDPGSKQKLTTSMSVNIFRHDDDPFQDDFFENPDVVEGAVGGGASFDCGSDEEDNWKTPFRSFDFSKFY